MVKGNGCFGVQGSNRAGSIRQDTRDDPANLSLSLNRFKDILFGIYFYTQHSTAIF